MRVVNVFLLAAAVLVASTEFTSATPETTLLKSRILRSHTAPAAIDNAAGEERDIEVQILDKMLSDHAYAKQTFRNWLQNGQNKEDIETLLQRQGLLDKYSTVVKQYGEYLAVLGVK
ncbi:hypothetical protein PRIC1_013566 [Phytophthora ramorum]|uniref:Secreted RxLR effector protein RXLR-C04 n=1 Tax=Phytophthora ramorum TaxID=164328 RepID=UPI0030953416|nr:Secreted RxLR effector protein RXLR-C04 [Phytophthora ramorum]KAH7500690.1 Secreted RxLR effector protein RXLR-C04 [Phytophthora ramorum]